MLIQGNVGLQDVSRGAQAVPISVDQLGGIVCSEGLARYSNLAAAGKLFMAQAIVTAPVIYSTAAGTGGPLLWNGTPGTMAHILAVSLGVTTVSTVAAALGLTWNSGQPNAPTTTTAIDGRSNMLPGGPASGCTPYRIGTVAVAGAALLPFAELHTGALTVDNFGTTWVDIGGMLVVPPSCWASVAASATASTTVAQIGLVWAELPVRS